MTATERKTIYRQWRAAGHTVDHAKGAVRSSYVIGHRQHDGRWVPVRSTDLGEEYKER